MTYKIVSMILAPLAVVAAAITVPVAISTATPQPAPAIVTAPVAPPPEPSAAPAPEPVVDSDHGLNARREHLRAYVLGVMNDWTPAVPSMPVVDYGDVASDIATAVIMEPDDGQHCGLMPSADGFRRCLWGVPGWNSDHAKGVLLAALGYWEGARYAAYVDDGRCDDKAWRSDPANARMLHLGGNCDNGHAHSLFQIHPIEDPQSPLYALCNAAAVDDSRLGAARCALELAGRSLRRTGTLSDYTGEFWGEHPKADQRLDFASRAVAKHPFTNAYQAGDGE